MRYIDPHHVDSPKSSVTDVIPVYDGGEGETSVALLKWEGEDRVAMRWNGGTENHSQRPTPGNPQSRGFPTWFVLPPIFDVAILQALLENGLLGGGFIEKEKAEDAIRRAITLRSSNGETLIRTDTLEEKMLAILEKFKSEGRI
jgi:hypothetical protein